MSSDDEMSFSVMMVMVNFEPGAIVLGAAKPIIRADAALSKESAVRVRGTIILLWSVCGCGDEKES